MRALFMVALILSIGSRAYADEDPQRLARARALFEQGAELSQAEKWDEAAKKFRASLALKRHAMTLYSLGVSERECDRPLAALRSFRAFLAEPATGPDAQTFRRAAQDAVDVLVLQVGRVVVRPAPAHASVHVDGKPCVSHDEPCFVGPGSHHVTVAATGYVDVSREVDVAAGETVDLDVTLTRTSTPVVPIVLMSVGGALVAGGLALTIAGVDAESSAVAEMAIGNTLMGVGLSGVAVGWTWLALQPEPTELAVMPFVGPTSAGIRVRF